VLKWFSGGGGNNVHFLERVDGEYRFDGEWTSESDLVVETLAGLEDYLVCEFVQQADYADDELFPETANTLRVLTMYDERAGERSSRLRFTESEHGIPSPWTTSRTVD